ncbi:hypothetical protein MWU77_04505 [Rhodococcus sp. F64268]|uniref:hypothetical protein n=1 Tax=Rhodococcus sp. F64268 TaxID=2926402 RepID=UPI001FF5B01C|nr:hypothetical protein [Rhodococcus sp. F64268]MCK0090042.1 hypothetical protein [Rhodococcus sp. F64268]
MPPQRRNPGPPRRRPKIAGASRPRTESSAGPVTPGPVSSSSESDRVEPVDSTGAVTDRSDSAAGSGQSNGVDERVDERTAIDAVDSEGTPAPTDETPGADETPETDETQSPADDRAHLPPALDSGPGLPSGDVQRPSSSWMPVLVVALVAVVLGVLVVVAAFRPGASDSNVAWVDQAETAAVTEAAAHAIEAMHGYNFETIDEDFAEIRELLTDERRAEFDSTAQVTKDAAVQTRTVTEVNVAHIGARMINEAHAEVAAYINVSATGDGVAQGSAAAPLLVRMEKADGRWLVSEIRDQ